MGTDASTNPPRRRVWALALDGALVVLCALVTLSAVADLIDWSALGQQLAAVPYLAPVVGLLLLVRIVRAVRDPAPASTPMTRDEHGRVVNRTAIEGHDSFLIAQRITAMVNRYDVSLLAPGGRSAAEPVCFVEQKRFALKEDLRAFADDTKTEELFRIKARQMFDPAARYAVTGPDDERIGELRKAFAKSLLRSTWLVMDADGLELVTVRERSNAVALVRRVVGFVPVVGDILEWLPIPYHFQLRRGEAVVGELRRIMGLRDSYALELAGDPDRAIDRRLAIALAVALDALQAR